MGLNDSELENLSDEERAALEGEEVDTPEGTEAAAAAAAAIPDEDPAAEQAAAAGDELPAGDTDPPGIVPRMSAPDASGTDEQMAALLDERKAIRAQYRSGDISADAYDEQIDSINERINALALDRREAALAERFNRDMAEQDYLRTLASFKKSILDTEGVNYDANPILTQQWDAAVKALARDEANADKPYEWFLREGHKQVVAEMERAAAALGFTRSQKGPIGDAARKQMEARRPPAGGPRSLATFPAAAADTGRDSGNEFAHLDSLNGDDLELAVARMTPEQQDRWANQ